MPPKGVKGFFRQKKKTAGISKPKTSKNSLPPKHGASLDLQDDHDRDEEVLRQFDMNMAYGPCVGMSRIARWARANKLGMNPPEKLGMNPPKEVELLLRAGKVKGKPLWDGRI